MIRKKTRSKAKRVKLKRAVAKHARTAPKKGVKAKSKKAALRKTAAKGAASAQRTARRKGKVNPEEEFRRDLRGRSLTSAGRTSGGQTGDLQGLSRAEEADSESVDELVEEGNQFEAGAVAGVEEADNSDEREVHTHEVAEDDVPEEYLEND